MKSAANAAKVGFLVICFAVLIVGAFSILGRSLLPSRHRIYRVRLTDAGGIVSGAKVLMAGVQIGTVHQVGLMDPHHAELTLTMRDEQRLPVGSTAQIPGSLIGFGDTDLIILPPQQFAGYLPDGSIIDGSKAGPLDSILPGGGKSTVANVDKTLAAIRKLLEDKGLQTGLKKLLASTNQTMIASQATLAKFGSLADRTNNLIAVNQGNIQAMILSMRGTLSQVQFTAGQLALFVKQGKLQSGVTGMVSKATKIEDQASQLLSQLNKVAADPALQSNLKSTVKNVAETTEKGPQIAENMQKLTANVAEITDKSKELPDKLNSVANKTLELEDNLNKLVNKFNGARASVPPLKDLHYELDETHEFHPSYNRTDINLWYPLKEGFVMAGLWDAFGSNKLNAELGHNFGKNLDLRYGIYASKIAIGADYSFTKKLSIRMDLFDLNSTEFDARLRYDLGGGFVGWGGFDRILGRSMTPALGIGFGQ